MGGGDLRADARFAFGHDRKRKTNHVYSLTEKRVSHFSRKRRISEHYGDDRVLARDESEAETAHLSSEIVSVIFELLS